MPHESDADMVGDDRWPPLLWPTSTGIIKKKFKW